MGKVVVLQSLLIVIVSMAAIALNGEKARKIKVLEETQELAEVSLHEWKGRYQEQVKEMELMLSSDIKLIGESATHYDEWKKRDNFAEVIIKDSDGKFNKSWAYFLLQKSEELEVDPFIVYELLKVETGGNFDPYAVGPVTKYGRAKGLGQFMHSNTAEWVAGMAGVNYKGEEMLFDPHFSIELTIVYLEFLYRQYGNWPEALTAYNRGMYGLEKFKEKYGHVKSSYAMDILQAQENHYFLVDVAEE